MTFFTGRSGFSSPAAFEKPKKPVLITSVGDITAKEVYIVLGYGTTDNRVSLDGVVLDTPSYLKDGVFAAPTVLSIGVNAIGFRNINVKGHISEPTIFSITRKERILNREINRILTVGGVDVTSLANEPQISGNTDNGVTEISFNLTGKIFPENTIWLKYNSPVVYTYSDGLVEKIVEGRIIWFKDRLNSEGEKSVDIRSTSQVKRLLEFTLTKSLVGKYNGDILQEICAEAGFKNVYTPRGNKYTGPRSFNDRESIEIVNNIKFVDQLLMTEIDTETILFLPDYFANFPIFTFNDDEIQVMEREIDGTYILNKGRIKYIPPDADININYNLEANVPDKSNEDEGYAFYLNDGFGTEVGAYAPDSVIFFAVWSPSIDFNNIKRALIKLQFSESVIGISTFTKQIDLEPFPDRKIAVGYFDLRQYHLDSEVPIYWNFLIEDFSGNTFGSKNLSENNKPEWKVLKLDANEKGTLESIITAYDVQMTDDKHLLSMDMSWAVSESTDLPSPADNNIVYAKFEQFSQLGVPAWKYEFLLELTFDDAVLESLHFDVGQAKILTDAPVVLHNANIYTEQNSEIGGHNYFFAVRVHEPNVPVLRVDRAYIKFTGTVLQGDIIAVKFNVWGRNFITSADFEDYTKIDFEYQSDESIAKIKEVALDGTVIDDGIRDGGAILSSYLASFVQAENLLKKVVEARAGIIGNNIAGIEIHTISVPGIIELTENQLIRIDSVEANLSYYYWIVEKNLGNYESSIKAFKITEVELVRKGTDALTDRKAIPDIDISLVALLDDMVRIGTGILRGTVAHRKYRGKFVVRLDTGDEISEVNSRIQNVKAGDTVLVAETKNASYIIVAIIKANFGEDLLDELLGDEDEKLEWQEEQENPPSDENDDLPRDGRPMGNFITINRFEPDRMQDGEVPLDVSFILEFSHPMTYTNEVAPYYGSSSARAISFIMANTAFPGTYKSSNVSLFFFCYVKTKVMIDGVELDRNLDLQFTAEVQNEEMTIFKFTPKNLQAYLGDELVAGFGNVVGANWIRSQINRLLRLRSRRGGGNLPDEVQISETYNIEPLFIVESVTHTSPYDLYLDFNQYLADDESNVENPRNYYFETAD